MCLMMLGFFTESGSAFKVKPTSPTSHVEDVVPVLRFLLPKIRFLIGLIILSWWVSGCTTTPKQNLTHDVWVDTFVNVREYPKKESDVVGRLDPGIKYQADRSTLD